MDEKRTGNMAVRVAYVLLFLMILYPLSAGPFAWLEYHDLISEPAFTILVVLYYPLRLLYDADVPVITPTFHSYVEFWQSIEAP